MPAKKRGSKSKPKKESAEKSWKHNLIKFIGEKNSRKRITIILTSLAVVLVLIVGGFIMMTVAQTKLHDYSFIAPKNTTKGFLNLTGTLEPGYVSYIPFINHNYTTSLRLNFRSTHPIDVYFVLSNADYQNFMANQNFRTYNDCSFRNKTNQTITCSIKGGGIVIYNPGNKTASFDVLGD